MPHPRITIVTPSFNQARYLRDTLQSIHIQSYPNLEHIVIDGGSTDGSVEVIRDYADVLSYWVSEPDAGQTDALIKGFSRATGDILGWLNSDDLFEKETLFEVAEFFTSHTGTEFAYGDSTWIDDTGLVIKQKREHPFNRYIWLYDHNFIPQPSAFFTRDIYQRVGGLNPSFDLAMDADLWIRFAEITTPRHVRKYWSRMRFYPGQKNTRLRRQSRIEGGRIRARYVKSSGRSRRRIRHMAARLARVGYKTVTGCYSLGEVVRHAETLFGRGSWEWREALRQEGRSLDEFEG
jgi:glycosyltransferase involved in cell wall biosynthesis